MNPELTNGIRTNIVSWMSANQDVKKMMLNQPIENYKFGFHVA